MNWLSRLAAPYRNPAALRMFFLGFSSGLPLLLVLGTLSFRLRECGIDLKTIGFMSWVGLCWGMKWLWAPLVDQLPLPWLTARLGRRRSWLLLAQAGLLVGLTLIAFSHPSEDLTQTALFAVLTAFFGATQDIALDAYRIESGTEEEQASFAAMYQTGYRLAMIWSGAGALALAAAFDAGAEGGWRAAYLIMAASLLPGMATVLLAPEPVRKAPVRRARNAAVWFYEAACLPFVDFFKRFGGWAVVVLLLIATYRISDVVMGVMANPFYSDMGFTKEEVVVALRFGVMKTLFLGGVLSAATNLLFSVLATRGHDLTFLIFTVSADNLAGGLASAAFVAYLSGLTNTAYSATQYALFSSVMLLLPKFLAGFSGVAVEAVGYAGFFTATACLGVPVLVLVALAGKARSELAKKKGASAEADLPTK